MTAYETMTAETICAIGRSQAYQTKDAYLATWGTLARYSAHVTVWRQARMAAYAAGQVKDADWTLGDCTCAIGRLTTKATRYNPSRPMFGQMVDVGVDGLDAYAPMRKVHEYCGGHSNALGVGGRAKADVEWTMRDCRCEGHANDVLTGAIIALREMIDLATQADAAWNGLAQVERTMATARAHASVARAKLHYGGDIANGKGGAKVQAPETLASDLARCLDGINSAPLAAHTCGARTTGETWASYGARNGRHCAGCQATDARGEEIHLAMRALASTATLSVPSMGAGVIRADRLAIKGRNANLGSGQGGMRITRASPLAG